MKWYGVLLLGAAIFTGNRSEAQIKVKGIVKDEHTGAPLSFVSVGFPATGVGIVTDDEGRFSLETERASDSLRVSMVGYKEIILHIGKETKQPLVIALKEEGTTLQEVSVNSRSERYRNKDNPAVTLIRQVIEHKDQNYPKGNVHAAYTQYERLQVSLMRTPDNSKMKKGSWAAYFLKNADTVKVKGKALLPIFLQEKAVQHFYNTSNRQWEDKLLGQKKTNLDGIADDGGLEAYFDKIYASTDVYDNNILLGDLQLLSPIAGLAPTFYKYFITDTLKETQPWQVQLSFFPRNQADLLFKGTLLVALDGTYAVTDVKMTVNKNINLNWVNDLQIALQYQKSDSGTYYLQQNTLGMSLSVIGNKKGMYGERVVSITDYQKPFSIADSDQTGKRSHEDDKTLPEEAWITLRPETLNTAKGDAFANLDTLKHRPSFNRAVNIFTLLLSGYEVLGPVEIGPVNSFYSFNPVEGLRLKLGGRTTDLFSTRVMLEGHIAYGFRDKKWKYNAGVTYSLTGKSVFRFPVRSISVRHSYETQIPGQDMAFMEEDNFLLSFKRGDNSKWLYSKKWSIEYLHEMRSHISFRAGFSHSIQNPAGSLIYRAPVPLPKCDPSNLRLSEFSGEIRWAPNEQFYQGKKFRRPVFNGYPIFTLRGTIGVKGFMGGQYDYKSVSLNIFKRFYLSQLGFSDVVLEGGKVFGNVPFPLLYIHKANQSYAYLLQSYNLMNFMEFISDRYISLNVDHSFNGFFLNKVPLVKKLQLREVASFKALYGTIGDNNLPGRRREGIFDFPSDRRGYLLSHSLQQGPYIEASVGISNIFKVLRIDVVKRFTYLDHPNITEWGVRGRIVLAL